MESKSEQEIVASSQRENKILLVTNIPTPYRIPLFNELKEQLERKGLGLKVVFGALGYARRKWAVDMSQCKFEYEVLPSRNLYSSNPEKSSFTYSGLYGVISKENPSVIITNAFSIATTKLWWRSWFKKTDYIIWSGAIHRKDKSDSFVRKLQRKILIRRAAGFIAYGTKAKEYLVSLGSQRNKVEIGINTVDTQFYKSECRKLRGNLIPNDSQKHLLYVGHLSPRKNVFRALKVINYLAKLRSDIILDIVGDGTDRIRLEKYVTENRLTDFVKFHGFKQKADIALFIAQSDCFLFPSEYDIWGLVLVEAMSAGLPCIASIHAGATHDLIKDGVTGFAMDFSDTERVAERINWLLDNPEHSKEIGQNASRFIAENVSIEKSAAGFVKAISEVLVS